MGVDLETWRCKIGGFSQPHPRWKWRVPFIALGSRCSAMLRLVLVLALCVSTSAHDSVTNLCSAFTPSELQTPHVWYSGHNEVWCGNTPGEVSSAWSASIHSSVTRACAADIELNPGPGPTTTQPTGTTTRTTRQSKLSTTGDIGIDQGATSSSQHAQPTLADLMQEMKKMRGDFKVQSI